MNEPAPKTAQRLRAIALSKPALIGAGLLLLYALAGFLLAPWLLRQQLPALVDRHLGAQGSVAAVRINPFLLTLEATDLAITEKNGTPAVSVGRLFVDFEASSLFRRAWTFREIRIERPVVNAELDAQENLNLARLRGNSAPDAPAVAQEPEGPPRLLLQQFSISGGVFRFADHTLQPVARAQFDPVNFEMHDVSTLPDHRGEHALTARLPGGGKLQWQGKFTLAPLDSSGTIRLDGGKLATPWRFVQDHLAIAEPGGSFDIDLRYQMRYREGALDLVASDAALRLKDVSLAQADGTALGTLSSLALEGGSFNLRKHSIGFGALSVGEGRINLVLDREGVPDWGKLVRTANSGAAKPASAVTQPAETPAPWQLALPKIAVGPLALSILDNSRSSPLRMTIDRAQAEIGIEAAFGDQTRILADRGQLALHGLRAISGDRDAPPVTLASAELSGGSFDLQKRSVRAELIRLRGGRSVVSRDPSGRIHLVRMFAPLKDSPTEKAGFATVIERLELLDYAVALSDQGFKPALAYDLEQIRLTAGPITMPPQKPVALDLMLRVRQGGTLKAKGAVNLKQDTADLRLELADLTLAPLATVLKRHTTATLVSGKTGAAGRLTWNGKSRPAALRYAGTAAVSGLDLRLEDSGERLLGWQQLAATGIDFNSAQNRLAIERIGITRPYSKLVINKDRTTNLGGIMRPRATPPPASGNEAAAMTYSIDRISVERGELDFADLSLVLPFTTNIKALDGSANGLSSAPESRAGLKFEGRIEDSGLARAEGTIQPFAPKRFTDIAVTFRNVALTPLSPYSATFAGRKIASGKLSLDLQYKLENSQLAGDNKVLLEQFTLGERVESPTAVNLPLDLAIALLTDSEGRIDLAVPVSGNVDNPEFSYGHLVWQAIRTVITRIVTAPFRALGALFGGGASDSAGDIVFDPGSARILPTEYEKLRRLAEGLQKRPQLKLVVQGLFHKDSDSRALRTQAVRVDLAAREGLKLAAGEDPGPVAFDNPKTQRALENMLNERAGSDAAANFAGAFGKTAGREVGRVNPVLALMGRGAGDRGLYEALYQRLIELQPLPDTALAELARDRGDRIIAAFTKRLKFDPARLGSKPAQATDETVKNGVPVKLGFEPIKP